jgi:hypothetical protein
MIDNVKSDSKYSAPKLVIYGDMAKFTASSVGSMKEVSGEPSGQAMMHRP